MAGSSPAMTIWLASRLAFPVSRQYNFRTLGSSADVRFLNQIGSCSWIGSARPGRTNRACPRRVRALLLGLGLVVGLWRQLERGSGREREYDRRFCRLRKQHRRPRRVYAALQFFQQFVPRQRTRRLGPRPQRLEPDGGVRLLVLLRWRTGRLQFQELARLGLCRV